MQRHAMPLRLFSALLCCWAAVDAQAYTELFAGAGDNHDLAFTSLTFTPDGSEDFYRVSVAKAGLFETDPSLGTTLLLSDDSFAEVSLTGGSAVSFYGNSYGSFFVSSNGYLTFGSGSALFVESLSDHFSNRRISALFDDLNPAAGGTVSYRQLDDRMAVTWQGVPEYSDTPGLGGSNNLQIELFFSGRIRITHLAVSATDGVVGLSAGQGLLPDFVETDFSAEVPAPRGCPFADGNGGEAGVCIPGQGTWQTSLQPRDFGNDGTIDAYYDPYLDLTWLADANAGRGSQFDDGGVSTDGRMTFSAANTWAAGLTLFGGNDWRLPTVKPVNDSATFNDAFSNNGSTDVGTAKTGVGWGEDNEMGYMYYVHLGNKGFCTPNDGSPNDCDLQSGWGLSNTGPFANLFNFVYWTDKPFGSSNAWRFHPDFGDQDDNNQFSDFRAWAVHSGDLIGPSSAPEPQNVPLPWVAALCLGGLLGVSGTRTRVGRL